MLILQHAAVDVFFFRPISWFMWANLVIYSTIFRFSTELLDMYFEYFVTYEHLWSDESQERDLGHGQMKRAVSVHSDLVRGLSPYLTDTIKRRR